MAKRIILGSGELFRVAVPSPSPRRAWIEIL